MAYLYPLSQEVASYEERQSRANGGADHRANHRHRHAHYRSQQHAPEQQQGQVAAQEKVQQTK